MISRALHVSHSGLFSAHFFLLTLHVQQPPEDRVLLLDMSCRKSDMAVQCECVSATSCCGLLVDAGGDSRSVSGE